MRPCKYTTIPASPREFRTAPPDSPAAPHAEPDMQRPDRTAGLRARIATEDAVQQCYNVTGEADYLLVVNVASMADYEALTQRLLEGDDNVRRFRTSVALGSLKTGMRVPLGQTPFNSSS